MKLSFIFTTLLISTLGFSQIQVQESKTERVTISKSKVQTLVNFEGGNYAYYYKNAKYKAITDIKYISINDSTELRSLAELMGLVINTGKEYSIKLNDGASIILSKIGGNCMVWTSSGYCYINKKDIEKILNHLNK